MGADPRPGHQREVARGAGSAHIHERKDTLAATAGATSAGRSIVGGLVKLIPGAGVVVGGAISASVASGITFAMGQAWLAVCQLLAQGQLRGVDGALDNVAIRNLFSEEFRRQWKSRGRSSKG